jgi:hypothetical protein
MCLQFHNTDTFSLLHPYPFSSLSTLSFSKEAFVESKNNCVCGVEIGQIFASLSSAKHKEFQIHGVWVQKLRRL